jgi:hypothetical protein
VIQSGIRLLAIGRQQPAKIVRHAEKISFAAIGHTTQNLIRVNRHIVEMTGSADFYCPIQKTYVKNGNVQAILSGWIDFLGRIIRITHEVRINLRRSVDGNPPRH